MNLLKQHKKIVALMVILSFLFFLEANSLPLQAESTYNNGNDQAPNSIEQEGGSGFVVHKKSPVIPIIIGLLALGAIAAVLILVVFKTSNYNIRGEWQVTWQWTSGDSAGSQGTIPIHFYGVDRKAGRLLSYFLGPFFRTGGDWTVTDKHVNWTFSNFFDFTWTGKFDGKNNMSGTMVWLPLNNTGTWTATRTAAATAPVAGQEKHWKK